MFDKVLVANRGVVAARVLRTLNALGVHTVALYSDADVDLPYLGLADETYSLGESAPGASYLNEELIVRIAHRARVDGIHPGYGFLSENAHFAELINASGACFIGPSPRWIEAMGNKLSARELMAKYGMSMSQSSGLLNEDGGHTSAEAARIGYPVLVKPADGGGGIGMLPAHDEGELMEAVGRSRSMALRSFGSGDLYLEHLVEHPRHVEFQVLADRYGNVRHLFERDCSTQRRYQKVIEEAGAPGVSRDKAGSAANRICEVLGRFGYDIIGTVETLYDGKDSFNFLEMNTRLQVEHAVTEEVTGVDLVAAQVRLSAGERLDAVLPDEITFRGHAIEARIYAEDPRRFYPSPGRLTTLVLPKGDGIRVEFGYEQGNTVTPFYDAMLGMIIAHGANRDQAIQRLLTALAATEIEGVKTNIPFIVQVLQSTEFQSGDVHTGLSSMILERTQKKLIR